MQLREIPHIGEIFALAAPIAWSVAIILFRKTGESVNALALNLFKNVFAILLFAVTLFLSGDGLLRPVATRDYLLLVLSGAIGIGISDTLFFMTLNRVGAGLQAIINTSYSPSVILMSFLFLGERMSGTQLGGVFLIVTAVLSVGWVRGAEGGLPRRTLLAGTFLGILATLTTALSIVIIKPMLGSYPLIWANCWRLAGGLLMTLLLLPLLPRRRQALMALKNRRIWPVMVPGTLIGTYVSLLLWLAGMKYTQVSTASALNQTATLWTFLLAVVLLREPVTKARLAGLALGIVGVAFVTFG